MIKAFSDETLDRRAVLRILAGAGAFGLTGSALRTGAAESALQCIVSPEQTEGPYFVDERLNRSDIRTDPADGKVKEGVPLVLELGALAVFGGQCVPVAGATVDVWHCDAFGVYSDVSDGRVKRVGQKFLRGYQMTDAKGTVRFTTIYPGWYPGRAVHIHIKVRGTTAAGRPYEYTSQLYFDEVISDRVHARLPYLRKSGRAPRNMEDGLFRQGGSRLIVPVVESSAGYSGRFNIGLKLA